MAHIERAFKRCCKRARKGKRVGFYTKKKETVCDKIGGGGAGGPGYVDLGEGGARGPVYISLSGASGGGDGGPVYK